MKKSKNQKMVQTFRIDQNANEEINNLIRQDPITFRSITSVISASIDHFLTLSKTEQREIIKTYLTKNL